jgi:MFS family permease
MTDDPPAMEQRPGESFVSSRMKWLVVGQLWFVLLFNYGDRQAIFSVFPLLKHQMSLTDVQLGILGSCFMWMYAAFGPFAGWIGDRVSRKWLIVGSLLFWSIVTATTSICHSFGQLVVCRALGGLGEAFYFPAAILMISDYHSAATRSRAMAFHQTAVYAGNIAGASIAAALGEHHGWRVSFLPFGIGGVILGMLLIRSLREPVRGRTDRPLVPQTSAISSPFSGLKEIFHNSTVLFLVLIFMGANFVAVVFMTWLPTFLYMKFHMGLALAGLNSAIYLQIASLAGVVCGGFLADRLVFTRPGGRLLAQAVGLLGGVPFLFLTGWTRSVVVLVLAMTGFGYFKGVYDANIFASLYDVVPIQRRAAVVGLTNSMGWLAGGVAPIAIAVAAAHFGMSACISSTACIYLFAGLWMLYLSGRMTRPKYLTHRVEA